MSNLDERPQAMVGNIARGLNRPTRGCGASAACQYELQAGEEVAFDYHAQHKELPLILEAEMAGTKRQSDVLSQSESVRTDQR
jgi:hypothetical protein